MSVDGSVPHELELNADLDGTIMAVTLYTDQADVTRTFSCQLDRGLTRVKISSGFPSSFTRIARVDVPEGVALGGVKTLWGKTNARTLSKYENIDALYEKKSLLEKSLKRCQRMATALKNYTRVPFDKPGMSPLDVGRFMESYEEAGTKWDVKIACLEKKIQNLGDEIDEEETSVNSSDAERYTSTGLIFTLSTETPKPVEFKVTYGVNNTNWYAGYDLFARSDNDQEVTVVYNAFISNNTGESWNNVVLKLESVARQAKSELQPWKLSFQRTSSDDDDIDAILSSPSKTLARAQTLLSEKATLPDKTDCQCFVLGRYILPAQLSRLCTPKVSYNVYLKAKVTNTCNFLFRPGTSGVYLDGNFVSSHYLSSVNPGEVFKVPLGTDPDIQVIYHPCIKDATTVVDSFISPNPVAAYACSQRITVVNPRGTPVSSLTIIDNIPTVEDSDIVIELINPPLEYPESGAPGFKDAEHTRTGVQVTEGIPNTCSVHASWDMVGDPFQDLSPLGANGKINWVCSVGKKESMDINLQWQVLINSSRQIKDF